MAAALGVAVQVDGHVSVRRDKAPIAVIFTIAMIAVSVADVIDLLTAALLTVAGLVVTRCMSAPEVRVCGFCRAFPRAANACNWRAQVRRAINLEVLIVIAASFGISQALINSGAAELVATGLVAAAKPTGIVGEWAGQRG
jgi:di/tricarboxylate transporter